MKKDFNSIRRIVTGDDEQGFSFITEDNIAKNVDFPIPDNQNLSLINIWRTHAMPTCVNNLEDLENVKVPLEPCKNGVNFRFVNFPPDSNYMHLVDKHRADQAWENLKTDQQKSWKSSMPHPLMHRTQTVDFGIVLSGEIYLILDKEERLMKAGEVVIQRGTNHAWSNRSDTLCQMAFILIDAGE